MTCKIPKPHFHSYFPILSSRKQQKAKEIRPLNIPYACYFRELVYNLRVIYSPASGIPGAHLFMRKGVLRCVRRLFKHSACFSTFISATGKSEFHAKNSSPAAASWDAICMHYSSLLLIARVRGPLWGAAPPPAPGRGK